MSIPSVQTHLAKWAVGELNKSYNLNAKIDKIRVGFPNKIFLNNAYVPDEHNDTLIYAEQIKIEISGFNQKNKFLRTSEVKVQNGRIYMQKWPEDSAFNFQLFLNKFKSDKPPSKNLFKWKSKKINVSNFKYIKNRINCTDSCTNIYIDDSQLAITNFYLNGNYVSGDVKSFSYKDRNRFDLANFSGKIAYQKKFIRADSIKFKTNKSEFIGNVRLEYNDQNDLLDFVNKVQVVSEVEKANMASSEFIEWLPVFPNFGDFKLSAKTNGTVNQLKCEAIDLYFGSHSSFYGDVFLENVMHPKDLFIDAGISALKTNPYDLERIIYPIIGQKMTDEIRTLGDISIKGKFEGGLKKLLADGSIKTDIGQVDVDVNLVDLQNKNGIKYKGYIALDAFDIGQLFALEKVGTTTLNGKINGSGLSKEYIKFNANLLVKEVMYNQYNYKNIVVAGETSNRLFNGKLTVEDPNLKVDFDGTVDFKKDTAFLDFETKIKHANLYKLKLDKDTISLASCEIDMEVKFLDQDWFEGYINLFNTNYENKDMFYFFDSVLVSSKHTGELNYLRINSQLLNASLDGDYKLGEIIPAVKTTTSKLYNFYTYTPTKDIDFDCTFNVEFNNTNLLTTLFVPDLKVESGTGFKGSLKMPEAQLNLVATSPSIQFKAHQFENIKVDFNNLNLQNQLNVKLGVYKINNTEIDSTQLEMALYSDSLTYHLNTILVDSIDTHLNLDGYALAKKDSMYFFHLNKANFNLGFEMFNLVGLNNINLSEKRIEIEGLKFKSNNGSVAFNGVMSKNNYEVLRIDADSLNLSILNYFINQNNLSLGGIMHGEILINSVYEKPKFISNVNIDSLLVNSAWVGNLAVNSDFMLGENIVNFNAAVMRGELLSASLKGILLPDSNKYVKSSLKLNRFRADVFNAFTTGILSNIRGTLTGEIDVDGFAKDPKIKGKVKLNNVALSVPYINGDFNFEGKPEIWISDTLFSINRVPIRDTKNGTQGYVSGKVSHQFFKKIKFNLTVDADKLYAMDLTKEENNYFYGKGFATGQLKILGPIEELVLDMKLKTEKGTDFKIPVTSPTEVSLNNFVTFLGSHNKFEDILADVKTETNLRGLTLRINVEVTPDANVELIMDETVGDIIRATGKGEIRMEMSPGGDFSMYGDYQIEKGNYLFTMRNLINKPFVLEPGGTVTWQGDPYEALLNLRAVYSTRTALTGVVTSPDYQAQKVKVDLYLKLKGLLANPTISFDIKLPGSSTAWQEELNNRFTNVDRLNQQAFSLLLLNSFWIESSNVNVVEQGVTANTSQMLFSQVSNWISSGTDFIDVNMSYSQSNSLDYSDEFEVELSKNFYDDRITVNGILDVPVGSPANGQNTSQTFAGDLEVLYKVTKDGRIQAKFFNRSNQNNPSRDQLDPYTQGVGILYRKDFETWRDFIHFFFGAGKKEEEPKEVLPDTNTEVVP